MTLRDALVKRIEDGMNYWADVNHHKDMYAKYPKSYILEKCETIEELCQYNSWIYAWIWIGQFTALDAGCFGIEKFNTQEELLTKYKGVTQWHTYGPIHKHGDKYYIQTYLGQHEWLAINIDDVTDIKSDPGWEGMVL